MKANTLDLRVGDHFIFQGKEFVVKEEESIGCVAEVLEPDEEWTGELGYLFAAEVVEKVEPKRQNRLPSYATLKAFKMLKEYLEIEKEEDLVKRILEDLYQEGKEAGQAEEDDKVLSEGW